MTDTTKPPNRPTSSRPRPSGRDGTPARGGDRPRQAGDRDAPARRDPTAKTRGAEPAPPKDDARIAKVMARAGLCSRRDAESWIAAGRVAVNGVVIESPALNVNPGDSITVDGMPLPERDQTRLYMFHKPRGLVTTARDPEGRPTIFDNLPNGLPRLVSVGRLDINTEGLMLLTNDGGLARVLELPATGWMRRYRVRANGVVDQAQLDALKTGVTIEGIDYAGIEATLDRVQGANVWLTMGLREGKNREIKRVLESLGLAVTRLIRLSFGPFQLGELAEGAVETVPTRVLREQLGPGLAAQAGVDFESREEPATGRTRRPEGGVGARPSRADPHAPRPHVGALRAAREEEAGEGRKRIQRGSTADRKGRAVAVERVVAVGSGSEGAGASRNARRFAAEKQEVRGGQKTRADAGAPKRFGGDRGEGFAAKPRTDRFGGGNERGAGFAAKPRGDRFGGGNERGAGFAAKPRGDRFGGGNERGAGFAAKPRGDRFGGGNERGGSFAAKPRENRLGGGSERGGSFAAKPRTDRFGGGNERGADFAAKPRTDRFGGGNERGADFAAKPRTDRFGGGNERGGSFAAKPRTDRFGGGNERGGSFAAKPRTDRFGGGNERGADFAAKPRTDRFGGGNERGGSFAAKPRGDRFGGRDERGEGFAAKPRGERSKPFEARGERQDRSGAPPRGDRPGRPEGERGKSFGDRPSRPGKPNGRPGGFGAERPATGRNKPAGRPPGGKPRGSKPPGRRP